MAAFTSERWPPSFRNGGRLQAGIPGRIESESAVGEARVPIAGPRRGVPRPLRVTAGHPGRTGLMTSTADADALDALLDELDAAADRARRAAWNLAELEELADEGEVGRAELAAAQLALEKAEAAAETLRLRRRAAEAELS